MCETNFRDSEYTGWPKSNCPHAKQLPTRKAASLARGWSVEFNLKFLFQLRVELSVLFLQVDEQSLFRSIGRIVNHFR